MAKNNKPTAKANEAKKKPEVKKTPKAAEKAPIVEEASVEEVKDSIMMLPNSDNFKGMSQDAKVTYADLLQRRYIEHPTEGSNYTPQFIGGINSIIDATVLSIAIDEAVCGSGSLSYIIKKNPTSYLSLVNMAKSMGIENLPAFSALPSPTEEQLKQAGIEASKAEEHVVVTVTDKNVNKETKKEAKKEHDISNATVEIDGTKIKDEKGLIEALQYQLVTKKIGNNVVDIVYRTLKPFRLANSEGDAKKKYETFTLYDWLMDAFSIVSPTILYKGIGKGMVTVTKFAKTPIRAFIIARASTMDRKQVAEGHPNPGLTDEETAMMSKAIIHWICNTDIKRLEAELTTEDVQKDEALKAKTEKEIAELKEVLDVVNNPSMDFVDTFIENKGKDKVVDTIYGDILGSYFGNPYKVDNEIEPLSKKYKNVDYCVQQLAGAITNLFITSTQQDDRYTFDNGCQKLVEYTQEEIQANKKAELEEKSKKA